MAEVEEGLQISLLSVFCVLWVAWSFCDFPGISAMHENLAIGAGGWLVCVSMILGYGAGGIRP